MIYFIIYIPFILSCFLDSKKRTTKTKTKICFLWVIILSLFWGLRWECGTDWEQFHDTYYQCHFYNIFDFDRGNDEPLEPGYVFINAIFNTLHLPYTIFLLSISFWTLFLWARFSVKYTQYPIIAFIYIIISLGIFFPTRQALAMAICTLAYKYILYNKSFSKFTIVVFIASSIHTSALFCFVIYFLSYLKFSKFLVAILYMMAILLDNLLPSIMNFILNILGGIGNLILVRLESYSKTVSSMGEDFSTRGIMSYILSVLFILLFVWKKYNTSTNNLIRVSFNGYVIMEIIKSVFANFMRDLMRLELFFRPSASIVISHFFGDCNLDRISFFLSRGIFACLMFYYFYKMLFGYFSSLYLPYKSIFL